MDKETLNVIWIGTGLAAGVGSVIALIAAPNDIPKWSVCALGFFGSASFSLSWYVFGWAKGSPVKLVLLHGCTWLLVALLGAVVWPKEKAEGKPQEKLCRLENDKLVDCTSAEVLEWGKPLIERLQNAVRAGEAAIDKRHKQYEIDHDEAKLNYKMPENSVMNRYLEKDYKNFVIYRAALLRKLKGGDPNISDPLKNMTLQFGLMNDGTPILRDIDSHLFDAQFILRDLQDLSRNLAEQIAQESDRKSN